MKIHFDKISSISQTILGIDVIYLLIIFLVKITSPEYINYPFFIIGIICITNIPVLMEIKAKKLVKGLAFYFI